MKIVNSDQSDLSSGDKSDVVLAPVFSSVFISLLCFGRNHTRFAKTNPIVLMGFTRQKTVQWREDTSFTTLDIGVGGPVQRSEDFGGALWKQPNHLG